MSGGLLPSATQCTTLPLASLTSNCKKQCGLAQNHSVTVPFIVTLLSEAKAAFPWCAHSGTVTITSANAQATCFTFRFFIRPPRKIPRPDEAALPISVNAPRSLFSRVQARGGIGKLLIVFPRFDRRAFHLANIKSRRLQPQRKFDRLPRLRIHLRIVNCNRHLSVVHVH